MEQAAAQLVRKDLFKMRVDKQAAQLVKLAHIIALLELVLVANVLLEVTAQKEQVLS